MKKDESNSVRSSSTNDSLAGTMGLLLPLRGLAATEKQDEIL
jgi:hypothetical protein